MNTTSEIFSATDFINRRSVLLQLKGDTEQLVVLYTGSMPMDNSTYFMGVVIHSDSDKYHIGEFSDIWTTNLFKPFNGSVTITQTE